MNTVSSLVASLNELSDLQSKRDVLRMKRDEELDAILTDEQREKSAEIETEFEIESAINDDRLNELTAAVKRGVIDLEHGTTVRGNFLMAIKIKGRVSWDSKGLDGFLLSHPEMKWLRKRGKPSCTIRKI